MSIVIVGDLAYKIESKAIREAYRALHLHPASSPFVSGDSFRALADHVLEGDRTFEPSGVKRGDVVFVATDMLERFKAEFLPSIRSSFVLVTHNSDGTVDASKALLADDERIIRWFAQNAICSHPKIVHAPIGLENRWRHNHGIIGDFRRLRRKAGEKKSRILFGFSVGTNEGERRPALEALRASSSSDELGRMNSRAYRRSLAGYRFVASPPGNGVDCHRTWEALYLGVVPIVKRSALYDGFPGLPVLLVDDWREISGWDEAQLRAKYESIAPGIASCEYLWMPYWAGELERARRAQG